MNFQVESVKEIVVRDEKTGKILFMVVGEGLEEAFNISREGLEEGKQYNKEVGTIGGWVIGEDYF